jgi:PTH1 family peptidyl-tRNA hydrolase
MLLLVGLGNPGPQYAWNRHNIGFMALDAIVQRHRFAAYRRRFRGMVADGHVDGARVMALKPTTFMNESGRAVGEAARFFKITPEQILVIHDDLDLAPGKPRVKTGGGNGGHRGLRSIDAHIGRNYRRLRLGIGHPGDKNLVTSYVLRDFAKADQDWLDKLLVAIADAAPLLARGEDSKFMNKVHLTLNPRPPRPKPEEPPVGPQDGV